jgi:hypothetical protein
MENNKDEIMMTLGRILGLVEGMPDLRKRVSDLELWLSWLKGAWAALSAAFAYLYLGIYWK